MLVRRHFRIARRTRRKEHQCDIVSAGSVLASYVFSRKEYAFGVEIVPALFRLANDNFYINRRAFFASTSRYIRRIAVRRTNDCFYPCRIVTVFKVVFFKLVGCRNCHRTELMKPHHDGPELIMSF